MQCDSSQKRASSVTVYNIDAVVQISSFTKFSFLKKNMVHELTQGSVPEQLQLSWSHLNTWGTPTMQYQCTVNMLSAALESQMTSTFIFITFSISPCLNCAQRIAES